MKCIQCDKPHTAFNEDAGTYKEHFCSEKCQALAEDAVDEAVSGQQANDDLSLAKNFQIDCIGKWC